MISSAFFYLKGNRDYVHSSNVFDSILDSIDDASPNTIDFSLSRMSNKTWYLTSDKTLADKGTVIGLYKDSSAFFFICESEMVITDSRPYAESELTKKFSLDGHSIHIPNNIDDFSFIEKLNAAFKSLLNISVFPKEATPYLFARLRIDHIPYDGFTIKYRRIVAGTFYEGVLVENKSNLGFIYFSGKNRQ